MAAGCDLSVVISTYNRCRDLAGALDAVLAQDTDVPYEVIVVDNNSTDATPLVVESRRNPAVCLRYVFEPRQGLPNARNAGLEIARGAIVAFTDDDVRPATCWVSALKEAFDTYPDADCIGGPVRPRWPAVRPPWLTCRQYAPLAIQDRGERPVCVGANNAAPCLIGANFAFRRGVFDRIGLFSPVFMRNEDREFELRLWEAGGRGLYVPDPVVWFDVPPERLTKAYFRAWFAEAGHYHAKMRLVERIDRDGRLNDPSRHRASPLGPPGFLYRQLLSNLRSLAAAALRRHEMEAFYHENRARYLASYIRERQRQSRPRVPAVARRTLERFGKRAPLAPTGAPSDAAPAGARAGTSPSRVSS